jgi:glutathione S-transferase
MHKLTHFRFCAASRSIRLVLAELDIQASLKEERPWEWRPEFLALNPAGDLPVLELKGGPILCGAYAISEYIAEEVKGHPRGGRSVPLFPGSREDRAEARRLVDWFLRKMEAEVTRPFIEEKIVALLKAGGGEARGPDTGQLRGMRANLRYHLSYVTWLSDQRNWLAGDELSFADFAAAAHFSCLDYLGEVPWEQYPAAKMWYMRLKSRRAFQPLLADRVPGAPPPLHYTNLDF